MASPLRYKYKWPSQTTQPGAKGAGFSDFVPYLSNVVNAFAKVPNPQAPTLINPMINSKISLADAKNEVDNASRSADLSTQGLDAQTGAAVRAGNLATRLRSLSDLNSRETNMNAQMSNQTNMVNANIEAQNAGMINNYHDDMTSAQMARTRLKSENISNAADKYVAQQAVKDQVQLEKDKANIYSKMYTPGVYNRLMDKLQTTGTNTSRFGTVPVDQPNPFAGTTGNAFNQFKNATSTPYVAPATQLSLDQASMQKMPSETSTGMRRYFKQRKTYAAGGMLNVFGDGEGGGGGRPRVIQGTTKTGETITIHRPTDDTFLIKDPRTKSPTTGKSLPRGNNIAVNRDNLEAVISQAKTQGVNPNDALAIAYQESKFNKTGTGFGEVKDYYPDQDVTDSYNEIDDRTRAESANVLAKALKDKNKYAMSLGYGNRGDAFRLQAYNGYGKLFPRNGEKAFYGVPVSRGNPIDMKANPLYGKTVVSVRDEVLKQNPAVQQLIQNTPAYVPYSEFGNGGRLRKYRTGGKIVKPFYS